MPSIKCHQASASQARGPQGHPQWEMSFPSASRPSPTASQLCCVAAERGPPVHKLSLVTVPPASRFWTPRQTILWITRRKIHHFLAGNCGAPQCWEQSPATELCFLFAPPKTASSDYSPFKQTMWLLTKSQHLGNANPASDPDLTFPTQMSQNHLRAGRGRKWMVQASSPLIFACLGWQSCMRYASSPNAMLALFKAQQFPRLPVLPLGEPSSPPGSCCL